MPIAVLSLRCVCCHPCPDDMDLALSSLCGTELARRHLEDCRQHAQRGDASSAMHCLLQAVCKVGGAAGASEAQKLRDTFLARVKSMDDLQSLLSQLQLQPGEPRRSDAGGMSSAPSAASSMSSSVHGVSMYQNSRNQASCSEQGNSATFYCSGCGGLFARDRQEQHYQQWCPALSHGAHEDLELSSDTGSDMVT